MAISTISNQYKYSGRGPLDAKSLVKTFADLTSTATWDNNGSSLAYNGMIVAVWLDNDTTKNGIYFLHDSNVKTARATPDVTSTANWHKLGGIDSLPGLADQLSSIQEELDQVQLAVDELQDSATVVVAKHDELPSNGTHGKIYVVTEEAATYVWHNDSYLTVGDGTQDVEIQIIHGGNASAT